MNDEDRIRQVLAQFVQLRDDKRFGEWVDLFTEDSDVRVPGQCPRGSNRHSGERPGPLAR